MPIEATPEMFAAMVNAVLARHPSHEQMHHVYRAAINATPVAPFYVAQAPGDEPLTDELYILSANEEAMEEAIQQFEGSSTGEALKCVLHAQKQLRSMLIPVLAPSDATRTLTKDALHHMNNALCQFARRWRVDGDYVRCSKCKRAHIASEADMDFVHSAGCTNAGKVEAKPWRTLLSILSPLYVVPGPEPRALAPAAAAVPNWLDIPADEHLVDQIHKAERPAFLAWVDAYIAEHGCPPAPEDVWFARATQAVLAEIGEKRVAPASRDDDGDATMPDENSPEFRAACSMAMKASQAGVGPCGVFIAGYRALRGIAVDVGAPLSRASDAAAPTTASLVEILDWIVGMSTDAPITNMARRALELLNGETVTLAAARDGATLTDARAHAMYEAAMRAMERGGPYPTLEASTAAVVRNLFAAVSPASVPETINENPHP